MTLNMLVDTSDLATPRLNHTIIVVTTPLTTLPYIPKRRLQGGERRRSAVVAQPRFGFSPGKWRGKWGKDTSTALQEGERRSSSLPEWLAGSQPRVSPGILPSHHARAQIERSEDRTLRI
jgi:hypothetical protein